MKGLKYSHSMYKGRSLVNDSEYHEAICQFEEHTLFATDEEREEVSVGSAKLYEVFFPLADELDIGLFELFDNSQDLFDIYEQLESSPTINSLSGLGGWKDIAQVYPLIVLDRLRIHEPFRGNGLAKEFISQLVATATLRGGGFFLLNAEPFELEPSQLVDGGTDERDEGRQKLRRLYSSIGFEPVHPKSTVMYLIAEG